MNDVDKQKIIELLQRKFALEKKKHHYWYLYHKWVENAWWKVLVLGLLGMSGVKDIKREDSLSKIIGSFQLFLWVVITIFLFYKLFKFLHYYEKIESCEQAISNIDRQLINSASH